MNNSHTTLFLEEDDNAPLELKNYKQLKQPIAESISSELQDEPSSRLIKLIKKQQLDVSKILLKDKSVPSVQKANKKIYTPKRTQKHANHLLVLGMQYKFSKLELETIQKKFTTINFIRYRKIEVKELIKQVSYILTKQEKTLILLNTRSLVQDELLHYLTKIEKKSIKYLNIQDFMEQHLYKCYIPFNLKDISFLEKIKPFNLVERFIKFLIDYTITLTILLLTSPVMLYATYKIKKESPGPIFFKQKRIGINGKEFTCIKFRSMSIDAEKNGARFATQNDERVYHWGKIMRATRIDELPQLWNVLKRDMHLIGPRPERKVWINIFEKEIPYYNKRHIIKPGLTGWAQVLYPYGANTYDAKQKLMYDLYYIKHWSLWLEIKIVWKTVMVILLKKGV